MLAKLSARVDQAVPSDDPLVTRGTQPARRVLGIDTSSHERPDGAGRLRLV